MAINAHSFTEIPDLVRETYFKSMKRVTAILDELSDWNGHSFYRRLYAGVQCRNFFVGTIVARPDDTKRRLMEIVDRRGFAHELRISADTEDLSIPVTRFSLQPRAHHVAPRSPLTCAS